MIRGRPAFITTKVPLAAKIKRVPLAPPATAAAEESLPEVPEFRPEPLPALAGGCGGDSARLPVTWRHPAPATHASEHVKQRLPEIGGGLTSCLLALVSVLRPRIKESRPDIPGSDPRRCGLSSESESNPPELTPNPRELFRRHRLHPGRQARNLARAIPPEFRRGHIPLGPTHT